MNADYEQGFMVRAPMFIRTGGLDAWRSVQTEEMSGVRY